MLKFIFEVLDKVYFLCFVLFYSYKKLVDSKDIEFVSFLIFKMNLNVMF